MMCRFLDHSQNLIELEYLGPSNESPKNKFEKIKLCLDKKKMIFLKWGWGAHANVSLLCKGQGKGRFVVLLRQLEIWSGRKVFSTLVFVFLPNRNTLDIIF